MHEIYSEGGKQRQLAYDKLKVFIANPGRFCLTVIGDRGTGKHYAIEHIFEQIKSEDQKVCLKKLIFYQADEFPSLRSELSELLKENQHGLVVIEDVDELSDQQQKLLFEALATDDGTFGFEKGNRFLIRIAFTSNKDVDTLRTSGDPLIGQFWDRISQLIVKMPSYKDEPTTIINDFYVTWEKMKFENTAGYESLSAIPKNTALQKFLEDNAANFEGGFRDLDKIACLYFNYRIYHYREQRKILTELDTIVLESVRDDFFRKSQMLGVSGNDASVFRFERGFKHFELLERFKIQMRTWALKEWKTIKKAEVELGFKPGSMKNYVAGKATKMSRPMQEKTLQTTLISK